MTQPKRRKAPPAAAAAPLRIPPGAEYLWRTPPRAVTGDSIFKPAEHPPVVRGAAPAMAMDDLPGLNWASAASVEGQAFLGYPMLSELAQRPEYRRVSEIIARHMTRKWIRLQVTGDEDKTDKLAAIEAEMKRLKMQDRFRECAEHDGFFGRGHIFIDLGDDLDSHEAVSELKTDLGDGSLKVGKGHKIRSLRTIEPIWIYPVGYNAQNPLKGDWYKPQVWIVMGRDVHRSRLITIVGREVPDILKAAYSFGGLSLTQMVRPYVENWLRARQSVSDTMHSFSVSGFKTNMAEALMMQGSADNLYRRVELFNNARDNRGCMVIDKEQEEFFNINTPLSGLDSLQNAALEQICSIAGIPLVEYLGTTPQGLNACLPGDILITTKRGDVPIREVTTSDMVMTRKGWAPLVFAGITKYVDELIEIRTSSAVIRCTGNHPIWIPSINEFVPAENVRLGDCLLLIGEKADTQKTRRPWHGAGAGGGKDQTATMRAMTRRLKPQSFCTERFGKFIEALSSLISTSIISTTIEKIIRSRTLQPCTLSSTPLYMASKSGSPDSHAGLNRGCANIAAMGSLLKSPRADENSVHTPALSQIGEQTSLPLRSLDPHAYVPHAANLSSQSAVMLNSVRENALRLVRTARDICARIISPILRNSKEKGAESGGRKLAASLKRVLDAGLSLSQQPASMRFIARNPAKIEPEAEDTGRVLSVRRLRESGPVYDLSVAEGHLPEFYANGILTHNSSEGEIRVFFDTIHCAQEAIFREPIKNILGIIQYGLFGKIDPEIDFEFVPLWDPTLHERAEIREIDARTDQTLIAAGVLSVQESRTRIAADPETPYAGLDPDEHVSLAEAAKAELAQRDTQTVLTAFDSGVIDQAQTLFELRNIAQRTGRFVIINEGDIEDARLNPPEPAMPEPPMPGAFPGQEVAAAPHGFNGEPQGQEHGPHGVRPPQAHLPPAPAMIQDEKPIIAAGVLFRDPQGRILFLKRTDGEGWAFPGGGIEGGETPAMAACRECSEEIGEPFDLSANMLGDAIGRTSTPGGNGEFLTFICEAREPFSPMLNDEHSDHIWAKPEDAPQPLHVGVAEVMKSLSDAP